MGRLSTGVIFVLVLLLPHSHGYIIGEDSVETLYHIQHSKNILYLHSKQILCIYSLFDEYIHNVTFFENMFFSTSWQFADWHEMQVFTLATERKWQQTLSKSSKHFLQGSPEVALNGAAAKVMRVGVPPSSTDRRKRYEMNERGFAGDSFTGTNRETAASFHLII